MPKAKPVVQKVKGASLRKVPLQAWGLSGN